MLMVRQIMRYDAAWRVATGSNRLAKSRVGPAERRTDTKLFIDRNS